VYIQTFDPTSRLLARTRSSASSSSYYRERLKFYTHPGLELLNLLLASLHGDLLSFIQAVLQVFDGLLHVLLHSLQMSVIIGPNRVSLHLLFQTQSLVPAACLSLQRALKSIHSSLVLALNVSLYLVKLKLGSENLPFLMLQCGLSQIEIRHNDYITCN
uniref:Uncharacterized protein n=1 Tax=Neolamprologus brichardi TaxID=32507 RepID=A0A3Q4M2W1_NEOBR